MQFYEYETTFMRVRRAAKSIGRKMPYDNNPVEWYSQLGLPLLMMEPGERALIGGADDSRWGNSMGTAIGELNWYAFGCPYYKVWPHMATAMGDVSIDIPTSELHLPYPSFMVYLARDAGNDFIEPGGFRLKSMLVNTFRADEAPEENNKYRFRMNRHKLNSGAEEALTVSYQFDGRWHNEPADFEYTMSLFNKQETLEEFFQRSWAYSSTEIERLADSGDYVPSKQLVSRVLKLAIATCFFGIDQHEVVMPDLPRRKIEKRMSQKRLSMPEALKELKREMNATKMWTIGREVTLPPVEVSYREANTPEGEHRELSHAHMRRWHMRWQKYGPGLKDRKLIFINPTVVRPDLPWATARGYRIPDENLTQEAR
jgi:hypothetical protein